LINELNANPLAVQKRLGHSDIQITLGNVPTFISNYW